MYAEAKPKKDIKDKIDTEQMSILPSENGELFLSTTGFPEPYARHKPERAFYIVQEGIGNALKTIAPLFLNDETSNPTQKITHLSFFNPPALGTIELAPEDVKILADGLRATQSLTSLDLYSLSQNECSQSILLIVLNVNNSIIKLRLPRWISGIPVEIKGFFEQKRLVTLEGLSLESDASALSSNLNMIRNSSLMSLSMNLRVQLGQNPTKNAEIQKKITSVATSASAVTETPLLPNESEASSISLCSLEISFSMPPRRIIPISASVMKDIAKFTNISKLVLLGDQDQFDDFNEAFKALSTLKLQQLTLCDFKLINSNAFDLLVNILPTWADTLTTLSLTKIGGSPPELQSIKFTNTLKILTNLNVLIIEALILGHKSGTLGEHLSVPGMYKGHRALAILLQDKQCPPLTSLTIEYRYQKVDDNIRQIIETGIQNNPNLSFFKNRGVNTTSPSALIALKLADNTTKRLNWLKVAVSIAFKQANLGNAFSDSIIQLLNSPALPDIPRLAGFDAPIKASNTFLPSGGPTKKNTVGTDTTTAAAEPAQPAGKIHTKMSSNGL